MGGGDTDDDMDMDVDTADIDGFNVVYTAPQ